MGQGALVTSVVAPWELGRPAMFMDKIRRKLTPLLPSASKNISRNSHDKYLDEYHQRTESGSYMRYTNSPLHPEFRQSDRSIYIPTTHMLDRCRS